MKFQEYIKSRKSEAFWSFLKSLNLPDLYSYESSSNPNTSLETIKANLDKPWDCQTISKNPNINWSIVEDNLNKNWGWFNLSQHSNITWEIIQSHPDKPWSWYGICKNPNITRDIIRALLRRT